METVEQKKQLLSRMMKDIVNVKVQIKMLQSKKMKGIQKDEFGEDIDEKIEELKEFFKLLVEAYVAVFESSQRNGLTPEGQSMLNQKSIYSGMKGDACLDSMMHASENVEKEMQNKFNFLNKPLETSSNKVMRRRILAKQKPERVKQKSNIIHVKATTPFFEKKNTNQRAMGKNQMQMTAPQMGRF